MTTSLPELQITERDSTLNPRQLRAAGFIPGTLYGAQGSKCIQVRTHEFGLTLNKGHRNYKLTGPGFDGHVRVQQFQMDPVSQRILNIELRPISAQEALEGTPKKKSAETVKAPKAAPVEAAAPAEEATEPVPA